MKVLKNVMKAIAKAVKPAARIFVIVARKTLCTLSKALLLLARAIGVLTYGHIIEVLATQLLPHSSPHLQAVLALYAIDTLVTWWRLSKETFGDPE